MNTIHVSGTTSEYDVCIGPGLLAQVGARIAPYAVPGQIVLVTDSHVAALHAPALLRSLKDAGFENVPVFVFPAGESSKNGENYLKLLNFLAENHITRSGCLLALGGGVVGDLAGFAAATYLRGIRCVQLPTTLLAAVDSSVGGKTAIDLPAGKNLAGVFSQPNLVLCDTQAIGTLPRDIFRDGCAEVIKYAVLFDPELFALLARYGLDFPQEEVIARCVRWKRDVVAADEFDRGRRMLLNLGHTVGHAVEACSGYQVSHGQAVAIGMAVVARASAAQGICTGETRDAISSLLERFGLPTATAFDAGALYQAALGDKKRFGGTIHLIVPERIGQCAIRPVSLEALAEFLQAGVPS